jgi:hypothetical protein
MNPLLSGNTLGAIVVATDVDALGQVLICAVTV